MKTVIFDLGGIFIDIDYQATSKAFVNKGFTNFDEVYSQAKQAPFVDAFERGQLTNSTFRQEMLSYAPVTLDQANFDEAWNAMLGKIRVDKLQMVQKYASEYRFLLYSNTNHIHLERFKKWLSRDFPGFDGLFQKVYYSCEFGFNKPYKEGFLKILEEQKTKPDECVFVDDTKRHVQTATELGIQAVWVPSNLSADALEKAIFLDKAL